MNGRAGARDARLFLALELPLDLRRALDERSRELRGRLPRASWLRPESMHVTLVFLGETDRARLPALHEAFAAACEGTGARELRLDGVGAFPPRGKARVLWVGLASADGSESSPLAALERRLASAARDAVGLEPDAHPFHPHVTLARLRPSWPRDAVERFCEGFGEPPDESFQVREATLFESELQPTGARYRLVRTYEL